MAFFSINWRLLLTIATILYPTLIRAQPSTCNFKEVDLQPCLTKTSEVTTEACCLALNQALNAGHQCLCSVLGYTNLPLASANALLTVSPPALMFPGCALVSPSLAACGVPLEINPPPFPTREPVASAPAQPPVNLSTNSNQTSTEEHQIERATPATSKNTGPVYAYNSNNGSSDESLNMFKSFASLAWLITLSVWIII
ncbi:uncharacterized protein A4U43_C08F18880 [Asparagus officinalis]|uniref:uncharacterized protein LOC109820536 n=1 Tax=Asparagus officinalis TaxID=4686 RepID=UPI00098E2DDC|nr:uncharacterized protein LOC109820536 [Asparagus officinalis]ONK60475.1 uncharacterized protein A4U43_C08F18880 [Asparagus officinalis]